MTNAVNYWFQKWLAEKKKVAELEEQVKTAEDHAYFAGSEAMREKLIEKACKWLEDNLSKQTSILCSGVVYINFNSVITNFRKYMEK